MHQTTFGRRVGAAATGMLILACAACSSRQELYSKLSERQANEMVAVLLSAGIEAEKAPQDGTFAITTPQESFSAAVRALSAQGYPRDTFESMGNVFKREGFVSSPLEERARLSHAMSQELANTIASIDGVITARVHLVMPENNPLLDKPQPSAAAVFIKHRADRNLQAQVTQIKALVVNSIEGLLYGNVTVALFPAEAMPGDAAKPAVPSVPAAPATPSDMLEPKDKTERRPLQPPDAARLLAAGGGQLLAAGGFGALGAATLGAGLLLSWRRRTGGGK
jgi:type III secretion protein J